MTTELIKQAQECIQTNQLQKARMFLMLAISENPSCAEALNDLAAVEIIEGKYQSGLELLYEVLKIEPKDSLTISNIELLKSKINE